MGQMKDAADSTRDHDPSGRVISGIAPGVYFASDGVLTADSLESAIAYLGKLVEPSVEG